MQEFTGILFTLKKRIQNIEKDDSNLYKYMVLGYYDGLDIHIVDKWYDLRPKGLLERKLQVDLDSPFIDQHTLRAFTPANKEKYDNYGFAYGFWEEVGRTRTKEYERYGCAIKKRYPFICMSVINLTEGFVKAKNDLQMIQDLLMKIILKCACNAGYQMEELHCAVYPSIGYSDFIILFLTDDLFKAANIISQMRGEIFEPEIPVVSNCYSVCGLDRTYFKNRNPYLGKNMQITIRINLKEGISARDFLEALKERLCEESRKKRKADGLELFIAEVEKHYYVSFGNSDCLFLADQPLERYLKWHGPGQLLNPGNEFFYKYVSNVRTSVRVDGTNCFLTGNVPPKRKNKISVFEKSFKKFTQKYDVFLEKNNMHIRSSRALQQIMKNFLNIIHASHGFDVEDIIGEAFFSLMKDVEYYISKREKVIPYNATDEEKKRIDSFNENIRLEKAYAAEALEKFKDYMGSFISDLIRSDRPFIEGNVLTHSSIDSATKLLFAYSAMLKNLTVKFNRENAFTFVVSSGGCDMTEAIDIFSFDRFDKNIKKPIIIRIPEMSLYDIQGTLFRILHEYMHFIGDRRRKNRYRCLVNAISNYIAWEMAEFDFSEERLELLFEKAGIHLSEKSKKTVEDSLRLKYQELKCCVCEKISDAIRNEGLFGEYEKQKDETAFFANILKYGVLSVESVADIFSIEATFEDAEKDCLQKTIYRILYESEKELIDFILNDLLEMYYAAEKDGDFDGAGRIRMAMQPFRFLEQNNRFRDAIPEAFDVKIRDFIEQYANSLIENISLTRENNGNFQVFFSYDELLSSVLFSMVESFSDCGAIRSIRMHVEDFLLSFIYEWWDIERALPITMGNVLRLGADFKIIYRIEGTLDDTIKDRVHSKVRLRAEQGYNYQNVDEMLQRIDAILMKYQFDELRGIREELEKYLDLCFKNEADWYSDELGKLYELCDMDNSEKIYDVVNKIICQWKNLGKR